MRSGVLLNVLFDILGLETLRRAMLKILRFTRQLQVVAAGACVLTRFQALAPTPGHLATQLVCSLWSMELHWLS